MSLLVLCVCLATDRRTMAFPGLTNELIAERLKSRETAIGSTCTGKIGQRLNRFLEAKVKGENANSAYQEVMKEIKLMGLEVRLCHTMQPRTPSRIGIQLRA